MYTHAHIYDLSVYLSICLSIDPTYFDFFDVFSYLPTYPSIYLLLIYLSIYLPTYLPISLSLYLCIRLCIHVYIYLFIYIYIYIYIYLYLYYIHIHLCTYINIHVFSPVLGVLECRILGVCQDVCRCWRGVVLCTVVYLSKYLLREMVDCVFCTLDVFQSCFAYVSSVKKGHGILRGLVATGRGRIGS